MPSARPTLAALSLPALLASMAGAAVIHVDAGAPPGGDGALWTSAYHDLQLALAAAQPGDEIWISRGTYTPSDTDAAVSFELPAGVALYGGFSGEEIVREHRDWVANETILSGDIGHDDTLNPLNFNTSNSGHVLAATIAGATVVLDGLIIEHGAYGPAGTIAGDPLFFGSGIFAIGVSLDVRHCTFRVNYTAFASGGAVYLHDSDAAFADCTFDSNYAHLGNGGAVMMYGTGGADFTDCAFRNNTCVFSSPDSSGGAIYHQSEGPATVTRCLFEGNVVRPFYSVGSDVGYGGGISSFAAPITVSDSVFRNNTASIGGGMVAWNEATIVNCLFEGNTAQARSGTIQELGGYGGGFCSNSFVARDMNLINCTFVNNHGKEHGGVSGAWNSTAVLRNCVLWNNTGWNPEFQGYYREQIGGSFDIEHCDIEAIFGPPAAGEDPLEPDKLTGCIDADPLFVGAGDYRPAPGSPLIDAGQNDAWTVSLITDLGGAPRFVDDPAVADTGSGAAPVIDLGAYERQAAPSCLADINADGTLNLDDVDAFIAAFLGAEPGADLDGNGSINLDDLDAFIAAFLAGCP